MNFTQLWLPSPNKAGRSFSGVGGIADNATGDIYLPGNTSFTRDTSGTGFPAYLDDDRPVTVNSIVVNEASPYAVFTVSGQAGQVLRLALVEGTAKTPADFGGGLQYFNGTNWVTYTPGSDLTMAGPSLLVRTTIVDDGVFEGQEAFALAVTKMSSGTPVYGSASIYDDGTGGVFLSDKLTGAPNTAGDAGYPVQLDDDRALSVDSPTVNEASDYAVFTLTGNSGQTVTLSLANQTATVNTTQTLKVWDGLDWVDYTPNAAPPTFDASGKIYVRVDIRPEQDNDYEGAETFVLRATLSGRIAAVEGTATIVDDGSGVIHDITSGPVRDVTTGLDDDRARTVTQVANGAGTGSTVTEGQSAVYTVTLSGTTVRTETYALALTGGTATLGADFTAALVFSNGVTYDPATGLVTVPAGVTSFTVSVPTVDDAVKEPTEGFQLSVGGTVGTGMILDNDVAQPPPVELPPVEPPPTEKAPVEVSIPVITLSTPSPGFAPLVEPALTPFSPFSDGILPSRFDDVTGRGVQHELRVDKPLPDVLMPAGVQTLSYVLPIDTFVHTDKSARVELSAMMEDGSKLPNWLVFDAKKGEFKGSPPPGYKGDLMIRVVARDEAGRQAETMIRIRLSGQGERQAQLPGKGGLTAQLRSGGILAWKGERDRLVVPARELALAKAAKRNGSVG